MVVRSDPHPVDLHIGRRIRQRRLEQGLTLAALGKKVGVVNQQVHRHEMWGHRLTPLQLLIYARALGVDVAYFFEGATGSAGRARRGSTRRAAGARPEKADDRLDRPKTIQLMAAFAAIARRADRRMILAIVTRLVAAEPPGLAAHRKRTKRTNRPSTKKTQRAEPSRERGRGRSATR